MSAETKDRVFPGHRRERLSPQFAGAQPGDQTQTLGLVVTNTLYHGVYFGELLFHAARMTEEGRQLITADGKHSADEERRSHPVPCLICAVTRSLSIRVF